MGQDPSRDRQLSTSEQANIPDFLFLHPLLCEHHYTHLVRINHAQAPKLATLFTSLRNLQSPPTKLPMEHPPPQLHTHPIPQQKDFHLHLHPPFPFLKAFPNR